MVTEEPIPLGLAKGVHAVPILDHVRGSECRVMASRDLDGVFPNLLQRDQLVR